MFMRVSIWQLQHSSHSLPLQNSMFHAPWCYAIADAIELLDLPMKLLIQTIVCRLWDCHHCQGELLKLARLTGIVVDNGGAVWSQAGQETVSGEAHTLHQHTPVP